MKVEEMIDKLYLDTKDIVLDGVSDEYKEELLQSYYAYLTNGYLNFDIKGKNYEQVLPIFTNLEVSKWKGMNAGNRLSELLQDDALESVKRISNEGYDYALSRFNSNQPSLTEAEANRNIELLNDNLSSVREFNRELAQYYVSEGTLDFIFSTGMADNMSLRIGRINISSKQM